MYKNYNIAEIDMHIDRRIVKTKASIKNAFMLLMVKKQLNKISVSDVAAKAQINRSTFYLHYSDVPAVLTDIENEIAEEIENCIKDFDISDIYGSVFKMFNYLTNLISNDEPLKSFLTHSTNHDYIVSRMKNILADKTTEIVTAAFPAAKTRLIKYPIIFAASGVIDCYINWCNEREKRSDEISLENMIRQISNIVDYVITMITIK